MLLYVIVVSLFSLQSPRRWLLDKKNLKKTLHLCALLFSFPPLLHAFCNISTTARIKKKMLWSFPGDTGWRARMCVYVCDDFPKWKFIVDSGKSWEPGGGGGRWGRGRLPLSPSADIQGNTFWSCSWRCVFAAGCTCSAVIKCSSLLRECYV